MRAGQHSRYSDWLQAGRSGYRFPVWDEIFRTCPERPWGPPSLLYNEYRVFPGGKERPGLDADPSPTSSAMVMKGQSYTSTPPMDRTVCIEPQCLYRGALYLTSVPVQGCTLPFTFLNSVIFCCVTPCMILSLSKLRKIFRPPLPEQSMLSCMSSHWQSLRCLLFAIKFLHLLSFSNYEEQNTLFDKFRHVLC